LQSSEFRASSKVFQNLFIGLGTEAAVSLNGKTLVFLLCLRKDKSYDNLSLLLKSYASSYSPAAGVLVLSGLLAGDAVARATEVESGFTPSGATSSPSSAISCHSLIH